MVQLAEKYFAKQPNPEEIMKKVEGFQSWLEINLDALTHNLNQIREKVKVEIIPCVKSNAYGHGIIPIVAYLMTQGVKRFLVAKISEAEQIREAGLVCDIINMDPLFSEEQYNKIVELNITQTVFLKETADKLNSTSEKHGKINPVWIKIDTGLGRVGVKWDIAVEFIKYVSTLTFLKIDGIFSTLSEDPELDKNQVERMNSISKELDRLGIEYGIRSIASSNAVFHEPYSYLDAVRPGIMLYGLYPESKDWESKIKLEQCFTLKARIEQIKEVKIGESLTYSKRFIASKNIRVGTMHLGYSDGFPRGLTQKGKVSVNGQVKPILGTVSVNHTLIDLDDTETEVGSVVEAISNSGENNALETAKTSGIMVYLLMVGLNPLLPRIYLLNNKIYAINHLKFSEIY